MFKPMLAGKAVPAKIKYPTLVQPKLDGIRATVVDSRLVSRTLKPIPNREIFSALSDGRYEGFDGELIVGDPTAESCYRDTCSFVMAANKRGAPWVFYIFDDASRPELPYIERHARALDFAPEGDNCVVVGNEVARDEAELSQIEAAFVEAGFEGAILRSPTAPYKYGRGSASAGDLLKLKRFEDFEAKVVGVYEELHNNNPAKTNALGRTERSSEKAGKIRKGRLGGFEVVGLNGGWEGVRFRVGSGFNAAQRIALWDDESVIGRTVTLKSFPVGTKDKPRHPIFLRFREDEN